MKVIIDRFEGKYAIVETEDRVFVNMPSELIPRGATEGSVISIYIDKDASEARQIKIKNLMGQVWEK